ncbi:hypothetical protein ABL840_03955 [Variovorax sp. NFACC27]|uniref:hypothetical protein n=1 Tax=unclassified Variovorax TaxID=663243 RepID=UPI0008990713|nr:hypothetical protein SAMN03159371_02452 [Variovorax sp. NFACC28]SEG53433.1 hypothetical protein SAMN03159365_02533 [Variovorax sp. NFACC29]SFC16001.1 hypothetical protein SAMN03159379_01577 [Variovorax sp. NFACC26]SFH10597.1 hypothetical protein SAMN03159447_06662 [Variovorax sp. NFACC27]
MTHDLWPPLSVIRSALETGAAVPDGAPGTATVAMPGISPGAPPGAEPSPAAASDLLLPLTELARRREAVARRAFPARWAPGRLVSVVHQGRMLGVLLDRRVQGELWQGWMAAGEADWAGAFDVLLEPEDEPFEPAFGVIQAWNVLTLEPGPQLCARVLGEVTATRLAAVRAVHDEWAAHAAPAIAPEPGRIALRSVGGVFSVLSGTPLGPEDPRTEYQDLYRDVGLELGKALTRPQGEEASASPAPSPARPQPRPEGGWWGSIRRWFGSEGWARPAFAVLALVVVVQNVGLLGGRGAGPEEDEVRFRAVPAAPAPARADLVVRWKAGVRMDEADRLLQSISADVVGGPGGDGAWRLRVPRPVDALAMLAASPLVESAGPAQPAQSAGEQRP